METVLSDIVNEVYDELGGYHTEHAYQKAMEYEFSKREIQSLGQVNLSVEYKGIEVTSYKPDLKIEDDKEVLVELKQSNKKTKGKDQMKKYLKSTDEINLGFVIVFADDEYYINKVRR